MEIYCSHFDKVYTKSSNYYHCPSCRQGWYVVQPAPLVVIGYSDPYEASPDYMEQFKEKDLSQKQFKRCPFCKDLLEKRKHTLCIIRSYFQAVRKRHNEFVIQIKKTLKGFKSRK